VYGIWVRVRRSPRFGNCKEGKEDLWRNNKYSPLALYVCVCCRLCTWAYSCWILNSIVKGYHVSIMVWNLPRFSSLIDLYLVIWPNLVKWRDWARLTLCIDSAWNETTFGEWTSVKDFRKMPFPLQKHYTYGAHLNAKWKRITNLAKNLLPRDGKGINVRCEWTFGLSDDNLKGVPMKLSKYSTEWSTSRWSIVNADASSPFLI